MKTQYQSPDGGNERWESNFTANEFGVTSWSARTSGFAMATIATATMITDHGCPAMHERL
jgi:hypothetical protein